MQSKKNRRRLVVFVFAACGLLLVGLCGAYWASEWADVALTQEEWDRPLETFDSTLGSLYHGEPRDWVAKRLRRVADAFDAAADAGTRPDLNRQAAENARGIVAALVAAEAHRAPPNGDPVAALVFGLRDVAVMPFSTPGKAQMIGRPGFAALSDHGSDAANRLREMGKKAVPTLIALLDDRRATRSVSTRRNGHHVLRYNDAAVQILEAIAGRTFLPHRGRGQYFANAPADIQQQVKAEIAAWWAEYRGPTEQE